jgi:transposase InsO family protein
VPYLREADPMSGEVIRSSKQAAVRYERNRPGELVHMDVKKLGKIPDGGGWKAYGIPRIERLMTDNARAYRWSLRDTCLKNGIRQKFIRPHCLWQNGKVERLNRTLATEWACRQVFTSNDERTALLRPGSSTTTPSDLTAHSGDSRRAADCHQRPGPVHLELPGHPPLAARQRGVDLILGGLAADGIPDRLDT